MFYNQRGSLFSYTKFYPPVNLWNTIENIIRKFTVSYVHAHSFSLYTKHKHPYILNFSISIIPLTMEKKITTFAIFIALMIVGGYILTFTSKSIPIPGSKFIVMGPYLTLVMILMLVRYPRFGTLSMINLVFGLLMVIFSPWMTLAIIISDRSTVRKRTLPVLLLASTI